MYNLEINFSSSSFSYNLIRTTSWRHLKSLLKNPDDNHNIKGVFSIEVREFMRSCFNTLFIIITVIQYQ